ncbi:Phytanoyl-CoA dioxygenase (PhyH) [compost metagenome]
MSEDSQVVVEAEPLQLPEKKRVNYLLLPDWGKDSRLAAEAIDAFCKAFLPSDDVCLVLWLPSDLGFSTSDAERLILEALEARGHQLDNTPDLLLLDGVSQANMFELLCEVQAVVGGGGSLLEKEAFARGLPVVLVNSRMMRAIYDEVMSLDRVLEALPDLRYHAHQAALGHWGYQELDYHLTQFAMGYEEYSARRQTPHAAYASMRNLFCSTNGGFNDGMQRVLASAHPPYAIPSTDGLFGKGDEESLAAIMEALDTEGLHIFEHRLSLDKVERLKRFADETDCWPESLPEGTRRKYEAEHPIAVKYSFSEADLVKLPDIQAIITDPTLLKVAQQFLGCKPILSHLGMWWSTAFQKTADSDAAQLYHFDMDKINFIQFFVYLTDVSAETGPHCFVRGSHKQLPMAFRRDGRFTDEETELQFGPENALEIHGRKGTMFLANTRGIHKGKHLQSSDRLLLNVVFASSLFGAPHNRVSIDSRENPLLVKAMTDYPRIFSRYVAF